MAVIREVHRGRSAELPEWALKEFRRIMGSTVDDLIAIAGEMAVDLMRATVASETCDCGVWLATEYEDRGRTVGIVSLHCSSCHSWEHVACEVCGECIARWASGRSPRPAYHSACRSKAYRARQRAAA